MRLTRFLRMGGHGHGAPVRSAEYGNFAAPHISQTHKKIGVFLGSVMWFWVFYRAKEDGAALLGFVKPWDAHGDHGDHGSHGHEGEEEHAKEEELH